MHISARILLKNITLASWMILRAWLQNMGEAAGIYPI